MGREAPRILAFHHRTLHYNHMVTGSLALCFPSVGGRAGGTVRGRHAREAAIVALPKTLSWA